MDMTDFLKLRPQLAEDADLAQLRYSVIAQPKIDGVRAMNLYGALTGRSLEPFDGYGITDYWSKPDFQGFDGEMIVGNVPNADIRLCSLTTGAMGRFNGVTEMPDLHWWVFDYVTPKTIMVPYLERYQMLTDRLERLAHPRIHQMPAVMVANAEEMEQVIFGHLDRNYEGTIVRSPTALFKGGRSTLKGQHLLRIKPWMDAEMLVTGLTEGETNTNPKKTNALGLSERSSAKAGKVPNGLVGSIQGTLLKDVVNPINKKTIFKAGLEITIGPGEMTKAESAEFFRSPSTIVGHIAKFKFMPYGSKDLPRQGTFVSLRLPQDLS